jgi:hypothetical protein
VCISVVNMKLLRKITKVFFVWMIRIRAGIKLKSGILISIQMLPCVAVPLPAECKEETREMGGGRGGYELYLVGGQRGTFCHKKKSKIYSSWVH